LIQEPSTKFKAALRGRFVLQFLVYFYCVEIGDRLLTHGNRESRVDADGFEYEVRNRMTLCRCGASKDKPTARMCRLDSTSTAEATGTITPGAVYFSCCA